MIHMNAREPTRHIIAGIATALTGVAHPYERYALDHRGNGVITTNYLWSTGHHPWGPFTNNMRVSLIFKDAGIRNAILTRTTNAYTIIRDAINDVELFTMVWYTLRSTGQSIHGYAHKYL
jgi:hypothetical protein